MCQYKLKEPTKNKQGKYYVALCALVLSYLIYMTILLPASRGDGHNLIGATTTGYVLWTAGAFITAGLFMIPTIKNDNAYFYTMAVMYANKNYVTHEEYMSLMERLNSKSLFRSNAKEILQEFEALVDKHKGKDLRVKEYHLQRKYAENLERVTA